MCACSPVARLDDLGRGNLSFRGTVGGISRSILGMLDRVFLAWAVDGDLDCDLSSFNLLAVHFGNSLLLQLLRFQSDETEASTLSGLVSGLKFLDHESGDWSKGDLGRERLVLGEKFLELETCQFCIHKYDGRGPYLLLSQVVWQVGNHDFGGGCNAVLRRATLLGRSWLSRSLGI